MRARRTGSDFGSLWKEWTGVVYSCTLHRYLKSRPCSQEYIALHKKLLQVIQESRLQTQDSTMSELYLKASDLARPWVTLQSFQCAEQSVLRSVASQCRMLDQHFVPHHYISFRRVAFALILVTLVSVGTFLTLNIGTNSDSPSLSSLIGDWAIQLWWRFTRQRYLVRNWELPIIGLLAAVIVVGFWCFRSPRRY